MPETRRARALEQQPGFMIEVVRPHTLLNSSSTALLHNIANLVNDAYSAHDHPDASGRRSTNPNPLFTAKRFSTDDQIVHELGDEAFIAVCYDTDLAASIGANEVSTREGKYGALAAIAAVKPWKGSLMEVYKQAQSQYSMTESTLDDIDLQKVTTEQHEELKSKYAATSNWEVSSCASYDHPRYRGQGLMVKCVDALVEQLRTYHADMTRKGESRGSLPIKLWLTARIGSDAPGYWVRRGFVEHGNVDDCPAGLWLATRPFQVQTLSRMVSGVEI